VPRSSPQTLRSKLRLREEIAHPLWKRDRSFFYRAFHLEEVVS